MDWDLLLSLRPEYAEYGLFQRHCTRGPCCDIVRSYFEQEVKDIWWLIWLPVCILQAFYHAFTMYLCVFSRLFLLLGGIVGPCLLAGLFGFLVVVNPFLLAKLKMEALRNPEKEAQLYMIYNIFSAPYFVICSPCICVCMCVALVRGLYTKKPPPFDNETIRLAVKYWMDDRGAARSWYGPEKEWDTSMVTDMSALFSGMRITIGRGEDDMDVSSWDTSRCLDMSYMFQGVSRIQCALEWDVSSVTSMEGMFLNVKDLSVDISTWQTSSLKNLDHCFQGISNFNASLSCWNVSHVTSMKQCFARTEFDEFDITNHFYNEACTYLDICSWDVSAVECMSSAFAENKQFNSNLSQWNTSRVKYMDGMFAGASSFNQDISQWDTSSVIDCSYMFSRATNFDANLGEWSVGNVRNAQGMFAGASSFNQDISEWDTSNMIDCSFMFSRATAFKLSLKTWKLPRLIHSEDAFVDTPAMLNNLEQKILGVESGESMV